MLLIPLGVAGIAVFIRIFIYLLRSGGNVKTKYFHLPELGLAVALVSLLSLTLVSALSHQSATHEEALNLKNVLPGALLTLNIALVIAVFLAVRGTDFTDAFGLNRLSWRQAVAYVAGLSILAVPLADTVNAVVSSFVKQAGPEQDLVTLFRKESSAGHYSGVLQIAITGVILAPLVEEFLFRGFLYGVFKRYIRAVPAGIVCSLLFALAHANAASAAGLFALAICFNIAYELTGSILVNVGMHSLFNLTSLSILYAASRGWIKL